MPHKIFTSEDQALLEELLRHRRDVRGNNFLRDDVADEAIEKILEAATLAPSVGFSQPWEFVVIRDQDIKQKIFDNFQASNVNAAKDFDGQKRERYEQLKLDGILETPVNIAVFYKPSTSPVLGQNSMIEAGEYSVVCAIQNMWLMSRAMNIGMGWVSILDPEEVKKILRAPPSNKLVAYLCIGHVKTFYSTPELEKLKWEKKRSINSMVQADCYPSDG